jgi:two-component system CAI-1 autoinducer sensor kinase/phosphatase CqsS
LWRGFVEFHHRSEFKLPAAAAIGMVGFPTYYWVWSVVFPQPFEDFALRGVGFILCALLLLASRLPRRYANAYLAFAYVALLFCLPVYFTIMLLANGGNSVWMMSAMAAFMFTVLLFDAANAVIANLVGSAAGVLYYWLLTGSPYLPIHFMSTIPILGFMLSAVLFLSYSERLISREKLMAAHLLASNIAHEMRTPLLGIRFDAEKLLMMLPGLLQHSRTQPGSAAANQAIDALKRIVDHTQSSNLVINMLLSNLVHQHAGPIEVSQCDMAETITTALNRFFFEPDQRDRVRCDLSQNFCYRGSQVLFVHVIFNLLKNTLHAMQARGLSGVITIRLECVGPWNRIIFDDTAGGIPADVLPYLFLPFRQNRFNHESAGIGLAFCLSVVERFGGSIDVTSREGVGSTFAIWLPAIKGTTAGNCSTVS